jgi:outer membrane protein assembly factor BamB
MRRRRVAKVIIGAAAAVLAVAGVASTCYRVLAPHELLMTPIMAYPPAQLITDERPFSELRAAPLVVEGRIRVYAEKRRIWADAPVGERYEQTPYWAFRRWPQQVIGVVMARSPVGPMVISQWSDGQVIGLDARRGVIAWRFAAPIAPAGYSGRRTGATVVYEPRSLLTAGTGGRVVLVVTAPGVVSGYDSGSGQRLWQLAEPGGCEPAAWTGNALLVLRDCAGSTLTFITVADGRRRGRWTPPERRNAAVPALCDSGRSECRLITAGGQAWLVSADLISGQSGDAVLTAVPPLEHGALLAGDRIVYPTSTGVAARRLTAKGSLWSWSGLGRLIAADAAGVYLLTSDHTVLGLSPATGHLLVLGCAAAHPNERWQVGHVHTTGGNTTGGSYVAFERLTGAVPGAADAQYYYSLRPVALVELYPPTKLPVWSGKFAACRPL